PRTNRQRLASPKTDRRARHRRLPARIACGRHNHSHENQGSCGRLIRQEGGSMSGARIPVAILVRVSTVKQETHRQTSELQAYAERQGYEVLEVCRETVSGRADDADRPGLRRVETLAREGKIRKVLVHEISRLARKNSVAHRFVETLEASGVSLYW